MQTLWEKFLITKRMLPAALTYVLKGTRHYYLEKDGRRDTQEINIFKTDTKVENIDLNCKSVTYEVHACEVDVVDLDRETTKKTEVVECQVLNLTNVPSPCMFQKITRAIVIIL